MTELSVIIPTRNRREVLLETLRRLADQAGGTGAVEVIVVDDGSDDGTPAAVSSLAAESELELMLIEQESSGPAVARNRGVERARAPVCLFLGDDTWPRDDLLAHHRAFHARRTARADALLGRVVWAPPLDSLPFMRWLEASGLQFGYDDIRDHEQLGGSFFFTSNVSAKAGLLRAVGGFDESFRNAAGEDIELGLRLERAGMALAYEPAAVAEHYHPTDLASLLRRMWTVGRASAMIVERHPDWRRPSRPRPRHRLKASGLTALAALPRWPVALREEAWRFLCHQTFREAFWAHRAEQPHRVPRVGARLVPRATREARAASSPARADGPRAGIALNQLVRFEPVLALARETGGQTLLDVGSGSAGLAPWLGPRWSVTTVDTSYDDYGGACGPLEDAAHRLIADARRLPFPDRSFDVTVAVDVLEHVAPDDRATILAEMCRVSARRVIVAGPAEAAALAADARLAELYRRRLGRLPGWLEEHLEHGFPETAEIEAALRPHGRVRLIGNESVAAHERIVRAEARRPSRAAARLVRAALEGSARARGRPRARRAARAALRLVRGGDRAPTYRTIAVLDVEPA